MSDKKVTLATWLGGSDFFRIDDVTLAKGVQREVPASTAKRLEAEFGHLVEVVRTSEGSKEDVRVPEFVQPVQPDDVEPDDAPDALASPVATEIDPHDSTQHDETPNEKE